LPGEATLLRSIRKLLPGHYLQGGGWEGDNGMLLGSCGYTEKRWGLSFEKQLMSCTLSSRDTVETT
jgi:hypothetical protein